MDRVFLSNKNLEVIFKYTRQGLLNQAGIDLNKIGKQTDFKRGIAQIMQKVFQENKQPQGMDQTKYFTELNKLAIVSSVNQILVEINRRNEVQRQAPQVTPSSENFIERNFIGPPPSNVEAEEPTEITPDELDPDVFDRMNAPKNDLGDIMQRMQQERNGTLIPPGSDIPPTNNARSINFAEQERRRTEALMKRSQQKTTETSNSGRNSDSGGGLSQSDIDAALSEMMNGGGEESEEGNSNTFDLVQTQPKQLTQTSQPFAQLPQSSQQLPQQLIQSVEKLKVIDISSDELEHSILKLDPAIPNVKACQVLSAEIPKSQYIVNRQNNSIYWKESTKETKKALITPGNYNITLLLKAVEGALNKHGSGNYKVNLDTVTEKVSVTCDSDSKSPIQLFDLLCSKEYSVTQLLGFQKKDYTGNLEYTSDYRYNLETPNYINLKIPELSDSSILKIPLNKNGNGKTVYFTSTLENREYRTQIQPERTISSLRIELLTPNKKEYLFEGYPWSITLCLIY